MSPNFKITIAALFAVFCMFVLSSCDSARAAIDDDVLTWTRPTTRVDGSALPANQIGGYRIRFADRVPVTGPCTASEQSVVGTALTATRINRPTGRSCYIMSTIDTNGIEGPATNLVFTEKCPTGQQINAAGSCVVISPPREPGNVQVQ